MKPLLKQKVKDRLQRTRQSARNKESRTLGLEAIGKLCRHERIIYYFSKIVDIIIRPGAPLGLAFEMN